jgi:FkbM family methyltransferase
MKFDESELLIRLDYTEKKHPVLIDVGSHFGTSTKYFAERNWKVIAFEPEPSNYKRFTERFKNFPNVTCIHKAVFNKSNIQIPFYTSKEHPGIHSLKPFHPTHNKTMTVETVRLDEVIGDMQITHVNVLKIDTEGADFPVLQSFNFNKIKPEVVICEFMDERTEANFNYTYHDIVRFMEPFNYKTYISEWAPIVEYSTEHFFLQCVSYPINHQPAWGNLIFITKDKIRQFEVTLMEYLVELEKDRRKKTKKLITRNHELENQITVRFFINKLSRTISRIKKAIKIFFNDGPVVFFQKLKQKLFKM